MKSRIIKKIIKTELQRAARWFKKRKFLECDMNNGLIGNLISEIVENDEIFAAEAFSLLGDDLHLGVHNEAMSVQIMLIINRDLFDSFKDIAEDWERDMSFQKSHKNVVFQTRFITVDKLKSLFKTKTGSSGKIAEDKNK